MKKMLPIGSENTLEIHRVRDDFHKIHNYHNYIVNSPQEWSERKISFFHCKEHTRLKRSKKFLILNFLTSF